MKNIYTLLCACMLICVSFVATAQVPKLNSYPASNAVIFLDFDGHVVNGTSWNSDGPIDCQGANINATQITEIFNRVAEDYRPFNINITTDSAKYLAAPATKRIRVVLTISSSWYGSAGGVAFTNSFTWGDNTPCFVFTALLNYNIKAIAEAASHEAGHTLGLQHQSAYDAVCNKTTEYNAGVGSGEIGWAPIMGVGYYRNLTLWHYGTNPYGCTNMQDDLAVLTRVIGYRTDDYSNTNSAATVATFTNNQFSLGGIIERPADMDAFKFNMAAKGRFKLDALPFSVAANDDGADVDIEVTLMDNSQRVIGVYNPATTLNVAIDTTLDPGTYYLQVQGRGNVYAPNYASLGSYTLNGSVITSTLPVHKLELKATTDNNRHKLDWDIIADETVVNQTLEVSNNGSNFQPVSAVNATARTYNYLPATNNIYYYRLKVLFDNGREFYSNITVLRNNGGNNKPYLIGNVVTGNNISISSPSGFTYTIHDLNGRSVAKGNLSEGLNTLSTGFVTNGLYIIQYANSHEQYTEKFMKQ